VTYSFLYTFGHRWGGWLRWRFHTWT